MKKLLKPTIALILFAALQALGGVALLLVHIAATTGLTADPALLSEAAHTFHPSAQALSATVIASGLLSVAAVRALHMVSLRTAFRPGPVRRPQALLAVAGALCGILGMNLLCEWLDLPDLMQQEFFDMARTPLGIAAIAVVGPVTEEIIFREAILGHLVRSGMKPLRAMTASALAFALLHGNPAQVPFALAIGLILALVWMRTGNILLTSAVHIINNSLAVIEMNTVGDPAATLSMTDRLGTTGSLLCIASAAAGCAVLLWLFLKTTRPLPEFEKIPATT